jgi:N-acetylglucosaminyl-diphospho-decaprenol L-rhamnosyltransferase
MSHAAEIDAVVVSYNSRSTLRGCLEPLAALEAVRPVVVDNASPEDPLDVVAGLAVETVRAPRNGGFSYGCNLGAARGAAPYILFLNPDARIDEAGVGALRRALEADPTAGIAAPRILDGDGRVLPTRRRFPGPLSTAAQALFLQRLLPRAQWTDELIRDPASYEVPGPADWVSGACMMIRRSAFEAIGGWDEGFFLYCEDTDICKRMADVGLRTLFEPSAVAWHEEGSSAPRSALLAVHARSRVRYARKHLRPARAALDAAAVALGAATHAIVNLGRLPVARGHARALGAVLTSREGV